MGFIASIALKLSPVGAFLKRLNLSQIALIAMAALCLFLKLSLASEQRHSAKVEAQLVKAVEGRAADRTAYETAQREAAALNKAKVDKIEARSQEITADVANDYASDLARLRAELGRVRGKDAPAQSAANGAGSGQTGEPAQGADGADELPLPPQDLLRAAEIELQLMHLQDWITRQLAVKR